MLSGIILYFCAQTLPDFQVNSENYPSKAMQNYSTVAGYDSGCVAVWNDMRLPCYGFHVYGVRQDILGDTLGANFRINDDTLNGCMPFPDVDCDFQGNFAVVWKQEHNIRYRKFLTDGTPTGPSVMVNDYSAYCSPPSIALDSAGYTIITWSDNHEYNEYRVYGQIYDPTGSPVGTNFSISDSSQSPYILTDATIDDKKNISTVWHRDSSIWCQRSDSLGNRIGDNFTLWTDTMNVGISYPVIERNTIGHHLLAWSTGQRNDVFCLLFDSTFIPQSSVIRVNDVTNTQAWRPKVEPQDSMWFVVFENDISATYLQRLDHNGTLIGNNTQINEPVGIWNHHPGIAITGEVVSICWTRRKTNIVWDMMSQKLNLDGIPFGTNTCISDDTGGAPQYFPSIAADTSGSFFIVWDDFRNPEFWFSSQYGRIFDALGNPLNEDFEINENIDAQYPSISLNNLGLYVTVWIRELADSNRQVYGQRFDRNGTLLGPNYQISLAPGNTGLFFPRILALTDNRFVTMWTDYRIEPHRIHGRILDPLGIPQGNEFTAFIDSAAYNLACAIVDEENGRFIIAMSCDQESVGVAIQEFDYDANPVSAPIVLNDTATGYVFVSGAKGLGEYLFVWAGFDDTQICGQLLNDSLQVIGGNFKISNDTVANKGFPSVVSDHDGRFFVLWQDNRNGDTDIYGQFLNADGGAIGDNFKVDNDTTHSEQWMPSCYSANNLIYVVWGDTRIPSQWYDIYCKAIEWPPTYVREFKQEPRFRTLILSPNPFRGNLDIYYNLDSIIDGKAAIDIYDVCGRLVRKLPLAAHNRGTLASIQWDGKGSDGNTLPAGVYFVLFPDETNETARKVVKLR